MRLSNYYPSIELRDAYQPGRMQYGGSAYYANTGVAFTGNKVTIIGTFRVSEFTGNTRRSIARAKAGGSLYTRMYINVCSSDFSDTANGGPNKLYFDVVNSSGTTIGRIISDVDVADGKVHSFLAAFDADTGDATLIVDGRDADDAAYASRTATTGTLDTASGHFSVGSANGTSAVFPMTGEIGFLGYKDAYISDWTLFFNSDGSPKKLDESAWTEWGGQPKYWHEAGDMADSKGTGSTVTRSGTPTVAPVEVEVIADEIPGVKQELTITNPSAETGDMTGWTAYEASMAVRNWPAHLGSYSFDGGNNLRARSYQDVSLIEGSIDARVIDSGHAKAHLRWYGNSYIEQDGGNVCLQFYDAAGNQLPTYGTPMGNNYGTTPADLDLWEQVDQIYLIPTGARQVRIWMSAYRINGTGNNGHIDDISVTVFTGGVETIYPTDRVVEGWQGQKWYTPGSVTGYTRKPPQTKPGDLLVIAHVTRNAYGGMPEGAGWTAVGSWDVTGGTPVTPPVDNDRLYIWSKIAGPNEPDEYDIAFTDDGTDSHCIAVMCIPNASTVIDTAAAAGSVSPSVNALTGDVLISFMVSAYDTLDRWSTTQPATLREMYHLNDTSGESHLAGAWKQITADGATGTFTWSTSTMTAECVFTILIR